jgi:anti-sigma B factor antagonist
MQLHGRRSVVGSVPVLSLSGAVDLSTVPVLGDCLARLVGDHARQLVAVDLDGVEVLDDSALGLLLGAAGRARSDGGELVVVTSDRRLRDRFAVTGLDRAVDVVERLATALTR